MRLKGIKKYKEVGYVLPGISFEFLWKAILRKRKIQKSNIFYADPEMNIHYVSSTGKVTINST